MKISFVCQVQGEFDQSDWCFSELRKSYPEEKLTVISNDDNDPKWESICSKYNADLIRGSNLLSLENGSSILKRYFSNYDDGYLIKIDPDTWIQRKIKIPLPNNTWSVFFGNTLHCHSLNPPLIQGGCMGFTESACRKLINCDFMANYDFKSNIEKWVFDENSKKITLNGLVSTDWMMRFICLNIGISFFHHREIGSWWKNIEGDEKNFAILHPKKIFQTYSIYSS